MSNFEIEKDYDYYINGTYIKRYFNNKNETHNDDGPARIRYNKRHKIISEMYLIKNYIHRVDGPALIISIFFGLIKHKYYYLFGECLSKKDYDKRIKLMLLE